MTAKTKRPTKTAKVAKTAPLAKLTPPLKWHGGKQPLAQKIIALMPPRCVNPNDPAPDDLGWLHYVEPYFGGGGVLLANNPAGISEVANDIHEELSNFWQVLRSEKDFQIIQRWLEATEFSASLFDRCDPPSIGPTQAARAYRFFVRCRQSLSGRMDSFAGITRARTRRDMNEQVSAWLNVIEGLPEVHSRLKRVLILNKHALDVIRSEDGSRTLFYLDPPYLHETRATTGEYAFEMTLGDHVNLLSRLGTISGRFMLSGYRSDLYDMNAAEKGWTRTEFDVPNNAAGGKSKRRMVECVWTNY